MSSIGANSGCSHVILALPDELVDAITERVLERLADHETNGADGFLDVTGAAEYLACPTSRIYSLVSAKRIPHHRDGSRLLFDRAELRAYVHTGGAKRP